jgi:hypothetical protein
MKSIYQIILVSVFAMLPSVLIAQQVDAPEEPMPLSNAASADYYQYQAPQFTIAQQRAWFEAQQRMYRQEWYNWIGYSPLRPTVNASLMSNGYQRYFVPSRGVMINTGATRSWYW